MVKSALSTFLQYHLCLVFAQNARENCFQTLTSQEVTCRCCRLPLLNTVRHFALLIQTVPTSLLTGSISLTKLSRKLKLIEIEQIEPNIYIRFSF